MMKGVASISSTSSKSSPIPLRENATERTSVTADRKRSAKNIKVIEKRQRINENHRSSEFVSCVAGNNPSKVIPDEVLSAIEEIVRPYYEGDDESATDSDAADRDPTLGYVAGKEVLLSKSLSKLAPLLLPVSSHVPNMKGSVVSKLLDKDYTFFRVFSKNEIGKYLCKNLPCSPEAAVEGLALPDENKAEYFQLVKVPKGTRVQCSLAGEAFGHAGGMEQYQLLERISKDCFGPPQLFSLSIFDGV